MKSVMENLLDYLLYALFGHNVTSVHKNEGSGCSALYGKAWTIVFEDHVYITLDEHDISIIRLLYDERYELLDSEERLRYERIFEMCK